MGTVTTLERHKGPWTMEQFDALPEVPGRRYELIDGMLVVTPSPAIPHQTVVGNLYVLLRAACPSHLRVMLAPLDVVLGEQTVVEPDLLVAPVADFTTKNLPVPPSLAIEVLSPSNRGYDLVDKFELYEAAGIASYWIFDPRGPELIVWELTDGAYVERARVRNEESFTATAPFPATLVPAELARL